MKIKIICNTDPIRVYHDPLDIFYNKKESTLELRNPKTHKIDETFHVLKKQLSWQSCADNSDYEEIHAIFYVKFPILQLEND